MPDLRYLHSKSWIRAENMSENRRKERWTLKKSSQKGKKKRLLLYPLLAMAAAWAIWFQLSQKARLSVEKQQEHPPVMAKVASFSLTRQDGTEFHSENMLGKVWLVSFMFTNCKGPCPMMGQKLLRIQKEMTILPDFHQVSITMDPKHDNPAQLRAYGSRLGADEKRWTFLTGEKAEVISIARNIFRLPAGDDPNLHSTRFVLIDQEGFIRGYYDSLDPESVERLKRHIHLLHDTAGQSLRANS